LKWNGLLDTLASWFRSHDLLDARSPWVLGVSGGPDSTLLLRAMHALSRDRGLGWELHVAHVHHGLRGAEADQDAAFVASLAAELSLSCHRADADVPAIVAERGGSTEEVARERRYEFLERVALKTGSDRVAVAHHADDDAETVLHRICRGTGLRGLAGMRPLRPIQPGSRVTLVRPLLQHKRSEIEALCAEAGIQFRLDATNQTTEHTRGAIRNEIMPLLRERLNPGVGDALVRLAEQARWLGTYLEDAAARVFDSLVVSDRPQHIVLNTHALLGKQRIIQAEVIRRAITLLGGEVDLSFAHVDNVLRLAASGASGKELHLPGAIIVRKVYDRLEFRPLEASHEAPELRPVFVACPGATALPGLKAELFAEVCTVDESKITELRQSGQSNEEWLDYARVQFPLLVRSRQEGDRFWPLGSPGSKSLSDFLSDEKVDPARRAATGVLCDQAGPIWVMPLRIDERVKLHANTRRALRLVLRGQPADRRP